MPTRVHPRPTAPVSREVVARWSEVPASVATDVLGGHTVIDPAIRPLRAFAAGRRLVGTAVTALCTGTDYGAVHHAIAVAEAGDVVVVECGGRNNPAIIGELLSGSARLKGVAGVIVNGAVRDSGRLREWEDFPVFTRHVNPRGPSSMEGGIVNEAISFAGARVAPGDLILGDDDGLVVIPREEAEARLEAALARVQAEHGWERELMTGRSTLDVFNVPSAI
ncbi:MAG: RraA family protein [Acetobacteraceae bacterium]|nr:RraA family protein [Acetobacteraceae bacterium]